MKVNRFGPSSTSEMSMRRFPPPWLRRVSNPGSPYGSLFSHRWRFGVIEAVAVVIQIRVKEPFLGTVPIHVHARHGSARTDQTAKRVVAIARADRLAAVH